MQNAFVADEGVDAWTPCATASDTSRRIPAGTRATIPRARRLSRAGSATTISAGHAGLHCPRGLRALRPPSRASPTLDLDLIVAPALSGHGPRHRGPSGRAVRERVIPSLKATDPPAPARSRAEPQSSRRGSIGILPPRRTTPRARARTPPPMWLEVFAVRSPAPQPGAASITRDCEEPPLLRSSLEGLRRPGRASARPSRGNRHAEASGHAAPGAPAGTRTVQIPHAWFPLPGARVDHRAGIGADPRAGTSSGSIRGAGSP